MERPSSPTSSSRPRTRYGIDIETDLTDKRAQRIASGALEATGGDEDYAVTKAQAASGWGSGFDTRYIPDDDTHQAYLAKREILFLLLDPRLQIVERAAMTQEKFAPEMINDLTGRLSEMLEQQVMKPSRAGGLSLTLIAEGASVTGWASAFLSSPSGAPTLMRRLVHNRRLTGVSVGLTGSDQDETSRGYLALPQPVAGLNGREGESETGFDVEAVIVGQSKDIDGHRSNWARHNPKRAAALVTHTLVLPPMVPMDASEAEVAAVLLDAVQSNPGLALASLGVYERTTWRSSGSVAPAPEPSSALAHLSERWVGFDRNHVLRLRALEKSEQLAQVLMVAALTPSR